MSKKLLMALLDVVGIPIGLATILINWQNFKGDIIFVLGATLMVIRMAFLIEKGIHEAAVRRWEFKQRKKEANERSSR